MNYHRGTMKQEVKKIIKETRPRPIWITLLYLIIVGVGNYILNSLTGLVNGLGRITVDIPVDVSDFEQFIEFISESIVGQIMANPMLLAGFVGSGILVGVLTYLWSSLMNAGYVGYSIALVRKANPGTSVMFSAFPKFGMVFISRVLVGVFSALWGVLYTLCLGLVVLVASLLIAVGSVVSASIGVVLIVAAVVFYLIALLWISYRFILVDMLVMDRGIFGLEALTLSKKLMKGNKRRMFVLELSFIGWYLLMSVISVVALLIGILIGVPMMIAGGVGNVILGIVLILVCVGLGTVVNFLFRMWLTPYISGSRVKLYEIIVGARSDLLPGQPPVIPPVDGAFGNPNYPKLD